MTEGDDEITYLQFFNIDIEQVRKEVKTIKAEYADHL
jgi:hypothetical protein